MVRRAVLLDVMMCNVSPGAELCLKVSRAKPIEKMAPWSALPVLRDAWVVMCLDGAVAVGCS